MRRTFALTIAVGIVLLVALVLVVSGCASDPTASDEACAVAAAGRHDKADATQAAIMAILEDPSAYGTREEVLDRLEELAAPGTEMDDVVFGPVAWRAAWDNTLFGGLDATIHTWKRWLSEDGSQGGSLWTWSGTAPNGEPFELPGINLDTYDQEGRETYSIVYYPLENADVRRIFRR